MRPRIALLAATAALASILTGCSAAWHTADADREVYAIVEAKQERVFGCPLPFSVEPSRVVQNYFAEAAARARAHGVEAPLQDPPAEPLPTPTVDPIPITMADALHLAVLANRTYQEEKEDVYLTALALTVERYLFDPQAFATGTVDLVNNQEVRERTFDGVADVGFSRLLADGTLVTASLGLTALKFINQELGDSVATALAFTLEKPLWRGSDRRIVQENLIQAERNALYSVRSFARFEQEFAVSVASQYLSVLQQRQIVLNEWQNYRSLVLGRERAESLAEAERLPEFQVDQARQDELRAYNRWIVQREAYLNALDEFKIVLGIPIESPIMLAPAELERLAAAGLRGTEVDVSETVGRALELRFDLMNTRGGVEDACRKVRVAEDDLKGDVDLVASIGYDSTTLRPQSARLEFHKGVYAIGLEIDLPIDRLVERNALRETQIDLVRAERSLSQQEDTVALEVRRAYRALVQARESYTIQAQSLELAERRVESTQILLQAGRASQRDVLEAQDALIQAQNALTRALVSHTIADLEFRRDVGTLVVNREGQIHDWSLTGDHR